MVMLSEDEIDQLYDSVIAEFDRLVENLAAQKADPDTTALAFISNTENSIHFLVKEACHEKWFRQWAKTQPVSAIVFLNKIHQALHTDKFWNAVNRTIQTSDAFIILQTKHDKKCNRFLEFAVLPAEDLRNLTMLGLMDSHKKQSQGEPLIIGNKFKTAAGDFQTLKQIADVRDEARRRLVARALIDNNFKTRAAATAIGLKSDGALAGNVRVLFGTPDYKRETIEPVIRSWKHQTNHPFQPVIEALVDIQILPEIEAHIQLFYPSLIMKAAQKSQFVKVRMAKSLDISDRIINSVISAAGLDEWYVKSHKEFLTKACEVVGYNYSQVAAMLNVDVRYVMQQISNYDIDKPNKASSGRAPWPY